MWSTSVSDEHFLSVCHASSTASTHSFGLALIYVASNSPDFVASLVVIQDKLVVLLLSSNQESESITRHRSKDYQWFLLLFGEWGRFLVAGVEHFLVGNLFKNMDEFCNAHISTLKSYRRAKGENSPPLACFAFN